MAHTPHDPQDAGRADAPRPAEAARPADATAAGASDAAFGTEDWRPARETRSQQAWRPGTKRKRRSVQALFVSSVLCLEAIVLFFLGMTVFGLNRGEDHAVWFIVGYSVLAVVAILTCAIIRKPAGIIVGWALQLVLILSGFWEYSMFLIGPLFALAWWYAVVKGRRMDVENRERDRLQAEWEAEHGA